MEIIWLGHSSFKIKILEKVVYIDPYSGDYDEKADIILISHSHYDHFSMEKVEMIRADETVILTTADVASNLNSAIAMKAGDSEDVDGVVVLAVDAYTKSGHAKGFGIGFVIEAENKRVYFAGDTDRIPEMKKITATVALLPIGGTFTMDAEEAALAVGEIKPKIAVPMHYGSGVVGTIEDAETFKELVERKTDTEVVILDKGKGFEV